MKKKYKFSNKKFKGLKNKPYKKHSQNKKFSVKSLNKKKSTKKLTKKQKNKPFSVVGIVSIRRPSKKRILKNYNPNSLERSDTYNAEFPADAFRFNGDTYANIMRLKAIRSITGRN